MEFVDKEWKSKGEDLIGSIEYAYYGMSVCIALSLDGNSLRVTYWNYIAEVYTFHEMKKHFTLFVNPPVRESKKTDLEVLGKDYDAYFDIIFDGSCITWSNHKGFLPQVEKLWQEGFQ